MHPVPTGSQDHLGMPRNHQIQNGTLNTLQPIKMSFGCISEIVALVLVTVIFHVLVTWCSVHFCTQEHQFLLVTVCDCLCLCHLDVHNFLLNKIYKYTITVQI